MVGVLIDDLARGVGILDFGDRQHGRLALRLALPNRAGVASSGGNQGKAHGWSVHRRSHWFTFSSKRRWISQRAPRLQAELAPARRSVCSTSTSAPDWASRIFEVTA